MEKDAGGLCAVLVVVAVVEFVVGTVVAVVEIVVDTVVAVVEAVVGTVVAVVEAVVGTVVAMEELFRLTCGSACPQADRKTHSKSAQMIAFFIGFSSFRGICRAARRPALLVSYFTAAASMDALKVCIALSTVSEQSRSLTNNDVFSVTGQL